MRTTWIWLVLGTLVAGCDDGTDDGGAGGAEPGDLGAVTDSRVADDGTLDGDAAATDSGAPIDRGLPIDSGLPVDSGVPTDGGACVPADEACNGLDDDCDDAIDEGAGARCYTGREGTAGVGECRAGRRACVDGALEDCQGMILPAEEVCNRVDDDCDGVVDEADCPVCGDGEAHPSEACDDGNRDDGDGCSSACTREPLQGGLALVCGNSARVPAAWLRPSDNVGVANGCVPGANTRAILISPSGIDDLQVGPLRRFVALGGNVITSTRSSAEVFEAIFGSATEQGAAHGECGGRVYPEVRRRRSDRLWQATPQPAQAANTGCGHDLADFQGITPLGAWADGGVSLAYRHYGQGRVWLVESDWPAPGGPLDADSRALMRLMMLWRADDRAPGVQQNMPIEVVEARGFRRCFTAAYDSRGPIAEVLRQCDGDELMIACRAAGAPVLTVAAEGQIGQVLRDVGGGAFAHHVHNAVRWYFHHSSAWGVAPLEEGVVRLGCDNTTGEQRMCWHTWQDNFQEGLVCGAYVGDGADYQKMIFTRGEGARLGALRGFGQQGEVCAPEWNDCVDAQTCAQSACTHEGFGRALRWESSTCEAERAADADFQCDLFERVPDRLNRDQDVAPCDVNVAHDVRCVAPREVALGAGVGFGAPGDCDGFNGCADAAECAARACTAAKVGAPIRWARGRCDALRAADPAFVCRAVDAAGVDQGIVADRCALAVAHDVVCAPPPSFEGVRTQMPLAEVAAMGFEECWSADHGETGSTFEDIDQACDGAELLLGCAVDDDPIVLDVAAMAPRYSAATSTRVGASLTEAGVQWYRNADQAWGLAPADEPIDLDPCDRAQPMSDDRLCWTASGGEIQAGARCGATRLNAGGRRVIYHRSPP